MAGTVAGVDMLGDRVSNSDATWLYRVTLKKDSPARKVCSLGLSDAFVLIIESEGELLSLTKDLEGFAEQER